MALFSVNRFIGEDKDGSESKTKASTILDRIHQEAEKRKLEKQQIKEKIHSDKQHTQKKRKLDSEESASPSKKGKKSLDSEKKTKKIKKKTATDEDESSSSSDSDEEDEPKEKKSDSDAENDQSLNANVAAEANDEVYGNREVGGFTVIGKTKRKHIEKVQRVLPEWLSNPSVVTADVRSQSNPLSSFKGLDDHMIEKLKENNITNFFPVQNQVIPVMLDAFGPFFMCGKAGYRPSDICCSAPTGSGKTLAFVLPIVQALQNRVVPQVRALVVLPVRDLASQVFKVFQTYCQGTGLKVGLITGQKTFSHEQNALVKKGVRRFHSLVDIVVSTPGRLVDHINQTEGFDLQHLRFLVIDEADRMMEEIKQDWLSHVEKAVYKSSPLPHNYMTAHGADKMEIPFQKLLFSATLSQNPEKLEKLNLFHPKLFTSVVKPVQKKNEIKSTDIEMKSDDEDREKTEEQGEKTPQKKDIVPSEVKGEFIGKYTTPAGLTEFFVECNAGQKPLQMLYFLHHLKFRHVLCFTNSVESTHRLYHLINLVGDIEVKEFSSRQHALKRNRIIKQFSAGKVDVLICSDAMARGIDIDNVQYVISYESPPFIKTYIHRVGRTARAGKVGTAITLLEKKEIYHFKKNIKDAGKTDLKELKVTKSDLKPMVEAYQGALKQLPEILKGEKKKRR